MNRRRRVLIVTDQRLFAEGIRSLLEANGRLEILGVEKYCPSTPQQIRNLAPDIIVLSDADPLPSLHLAAILDAVPGVPVVRLTLGDNEIHVYDGHRVVPQQADELVEILNSLVSSHSQGQ